MGDNYRRGRGGGISGRAYQRLALPLLQHHGRDLKRGMIREEKKKEEYHYDYDG